MIHTLTVSEASLFRGLAPPSLRAALAAGSLPKHTILLGLYTGGCAAGLLVGELSVDAPSASVHSVTVARAFRSRGYGTNLLREFEQLMIEQARSHLLITHYGDGTIPAVVQGFLRHSGWPALYPSSLLCTADFETLSQAPWMNIWRHASSFEYCFWNDVSPSERESILARQERDPFFDHDLSPFLMEEQMEHSSSMALRHKGRLIGWCISRRVDEHTIQCSSLFVEEQYQRLGRAVMLLARCMEVHRYTPMHQYLFDVKLQRPAMVAFVEHRLRPYLKSLQYVSTAVKNLETSSRQTTDESPLTSLTGAWG